MTPCPLTLRKVECGKNQWRQKHSFRVKLNDSITPMYQLPAGERVPVTAAIKWALLKKQQREAGELNGRPGLALPC